MKMFLEGAGLVVLGALGAVLVSAASSGCSSYFNCDEIVRNIDPGVYVLDPSGPRTEIGIDQDYRLEVSAEGGEIVETFTREGQAHRNVYRASAEIPNPLRSDRSASAD